MPLPQPTAQDQKQQHQSISEPFLYLAPIKGLTDATFRNIFSLHFKGFDAAIAPFINPQRKAAFDDKLLRDILPEENTGLTTIPQILHTDPEDFLRLGARLAQLGYSEVNWNLGCPVPMVAKKKRGSGLLPYPEEILQVLEQLANNLEQALSLKTRLGYFNNTELLDLLPELERFQLTEIIIHARLGKQLYRGVTDPESFARCQTATSHQLSYNGDINDLATYQTLQLQFPSIQRWMLGRGALANPFLAEEIKQIPSGDRQQRLSRLEAFHTELLEQYNQRLSGPGHLLGRTKQLWSYLIASFPAQQSMLKKITKCSSGESYRRLTDELFAAAKHEAGSAQQKRQQP